MASFYSIYYDLGVQSSGVIGFDDLQRVLDLITYEAHWGSSRRYWSAQVDR